MTTTLPTRATSLAFRAEPRAFAAAVAWVAKHLPNRPDLPVLGGLLLDVADGGQLTVSGFDYHVATRADVDVVGDTAGRALVSGRLLAELVKTFPDKPVDVATDGTKVTVKCGSLRLGLPLMTVDDYPALPDAPAAIGTVVAADLAALIERVGLAADRSGAGGVKSFHGIHLRFGGDRITAAATDRYRAAVGHIPWQPAGADPMQALVPSPILLDVARAFDGTGEVTIGADDHQVSFTAPGRTLIARQLAEQFPTTQIDAIIPARADAPATVATADLTLALKRAGMVHAPKSPVILTFAPDGLSVAAKGDIADSGEVIDCQYDGPERVVAINPQYLTDALVGLRGDVAEIHLADPKRPVLLTAPDDAQQAYRHVVVPINHTR